MPKAIDVFSDCNHRYDDGLPGPCLDCVDKAVADARAAGYATGYAADVIAERELSRLKDGGR